MGTDAVDVLNLGTVSLELQHCVISTGTLVFERAPEQLANFVQASMIRYFDLRAILETYHHDFGASLDYDYAL